MKKRDGHFDRLGRSIPVDRAERGCFGKKVFESRNAARDWHAGSKKRHGNSDQQPYRCHVCGKWHLTKLPKTAQAAARAKDWKESTTMSAGINTKPPVGNLRFHNRPRDADEIPIGTKVRTPTGALAVVEGYRGGRRVGGGDKDNHERLVCRYLNPTNRRWGFVLLRAELVEIVKEEGEDHGS